MKGQYTKLTALLLSLIMLMCGISPSTGAVNTQSAQSATDNVSAVSPAETNSSAYDDEYETCVVEGEQIIHGDVIGNVAEVSELREENVKHFRLSNGTYEAIVYGSAVHRKDADGAWQDINNDLSLQSTKDGSKLATSDGRVSFASEFGYNTDIMTLSENGYAISMRPIKQSSGSLSASSDGIAEKILPSVTNSSKTRAPTFDTVEEAAKIENTSSLKYTGIRPNTSIEYVLQGNNVKENIILTGKSDGYSYGFELRLSGLTASLESGSIIIRDAKTDEEKYNIPAPYMYDAEGNVSYEVTYQLQEISSGRYLLVMTASEAWINAEERVFPVTIDPTLNYVDITHDTYSNSASSSTNYGSSTEMWVSATRTSYIKMYIPFLPDGATVNDAYLGVPYYYNVTTGYLTACAYRILSGWSESTLTHSNAPTVSSGALSGDELVAGSNVTSSSPAYAYFNITNAFCDWYDGSAVNHGVAIKRIGGDNNSVILKSSESSGDDHPYLSINYTYYIPDGVYALENFRYDTQWMTVESSSYSTGKKLQHINNDTSPATSFDRTCLFKISRKAGTEQYIIRYMRNNNLSFGISGTSIVTKTIPSDDADVANADTFYIEWDGYAYKLRPYGSSKIIRLNTTADADLTLTSQTDTSPEALWTLHQYTGAHKSGFIFSTNAQWSSIGIIQGEEIMTNAKFWFTQINSEPVVRLGDEYEDMGVLTWNDDTGIMSFLPQNLGSVSIRLVVCHRDGTETGLGGFSHRIVPQEGTYYIQNVYSERFVSIEGPSMTSGASIEQYNFSRGDYKLWTVEHVSGSNGYVRFKSEYSGLYIGVDPDTNIRIMQFDTENDYTLWRLDRTTSGNLKITCKATSSSGSSLTIPSAGNANGLNILNQAYTDDEVYRDEWVIHNSNDYHHLDLQSRVFYDASVTLSSSEIALTYGNATREFMSKFGILFSNTSVSHSSLLDLDSNCHSGGLGELCTVECGNESSCQSSHHKSCYRLLGLLQSDSYYTYRLVGYALCRTTDTGHG